MSSASTLVVNSLNGSNESLPTWTSAIVLPKDLPMASAAAEKPSPANLVDTSGASRFDSRRTYKKLKSLAQYESLGSTIVDAALAEPNLMLVNLIPIINEPYNVYSLPKRSRPTPMLMCLNSQQIPDVQLSIPAPTPPTTVRASLLPHKVTSLPKDIESSESRKQSVWASTNSSRPIAGGRSHSRRNNSAVIQSQTNPAPISAKSEPLKDALIQKKWRL